MTGHVGTRVEGDGLVAINWWNLKIKTIEESVYILGVTRTPLGS